MDGQSGISGVSSLAVSRSPGPQQMPWPDPPLQVEPYTVPTLPAQEPETPCLPMSLDVAGAASPGIGAGQSINIGPIGTTPGSVSSDWARPPTPQGARGGRSSRPSTPRLDRLTDKSRSSSRARKEAEAEKKENERLRAEMRKMQARERECHYRTT